MFFGWFPVWRNWPGAGHPRCARTARVVHAAWRSVPTDAPRTRRPVQEATHDDDDDVWNTEVDGVCRRNSEDEVFIRGLEESVWDGWMDGWMDGSNQTINQSINHVSFLVLPQRALTKKSETLLQSATFFNGWGKRPTTPHKNTTTRRRSSFPSFVPFLVFSQLITNLQQQQHSFIHSLIFINIDSLSHHVSLDYSLVFGKRSVIGHYFGTQQLLDSIE